MKTILQTDEKVYLNISLEAGKPVHYEIFWDDGEITNMDENCEDQVFVRPIFIVFSSY